MSAGRPDAPPWWSSAQEAPRCHSRQAGRGHDHGVGSDEACRTCPVCSLLRAIAAARPELVEHLTEATRHLTLAAKAIIDAQVTTFTDPGPRLERIPLDDDDHRAGDG